MSENPSFTEFYEELFDRVYNYARHRTGSAVRADEIVSETFSRVLKSWSRFDPAKGDRRTWLFSIAFRAVADHYRSQTRLGWSSLELAPDPLDWRDGPPQLLEKEQDKRDLTTALSRLEDQHREIVSLKFFSGMTNRAIADLVGLTESNVAVILFRSIRRMRTHLSVVEADHG